MRAQKSPLRAERASPVSYTHLDVYKRQTERNGIYIIDLQKTVKKLDESYSFVRDTATAGGSIL